MPKQKATKELLLEEGYAKAFESILFAVYTKDRNCIGEFEKNFEWNKNGEEHKKRLGYEKEKMNQNKSDEQLGKFLSLILRHRPETIG